MKETVVPVRFSHLVGNTGVGAIVRDGRKTFIIRDIREWTDEFGNPAGEIIAYVERVKSALGITGDLRKPPIARLQDKKTGYIEGSCVPASRFPFWTCCSKCGKLEFKPWINKDKSEQLTCSCGNGRLEQVSWVLVDERGYISDLPWDRLIHANKSSCRFKDQLYFHEDSNKLKCKHCNADVNFNPNGQFPPFRSGNQQPWTWNDKVVAQENQSKSDSSDYTPPEASRLMAINDARVYQAQTDIGLVIPPESRVRQGTVVDALYRNSKLRAEIDSADDREKRRIIKKQARDKYKCSVNEVENALIEIEKGYPLYGQSLTGGQLEEGEYEAFQEVLKDQSEDEDFVIYDRTESWKKLNAQPNTSKNLSVIDKLIRVEKLKAIKVFKGFKRGFGLNAEVVPPDIVDENIWLPAIELFGEGVFFTLNESLLQNWEAQPEVEKRFSDILLRFGAAGLDKPKQLTARFILLHTLSHLLIREIEKQGGYPAASLNERIYCRQGASNPMAGILIYVAVPDVAGSLGGLSELAEAASFKRVLSNAIEKASWCSFDPVCREDEGQGPNLLNRAACHACALVPDPACDYGNALLDRIFLQGDPSINLKSIFDFNEDDDGC